MESNLRDEQVWMAVGSLMFLAMVALALGLAYTGAVMVPFVLAIFITVMISPVFDFPVVRWKFPRWLAAVTTLLFVLAVLALFGLMVFAAFPDVKTAGELAEEQVADEVVGQDYARYGHGLDKLTGWLLATLKAWNIDLDETAVEVELQRVAEGLQSKLLYVVSEAVSTATGLVSQGFLILIFVIFLLAGRDPHAVRSGIYADVESKIRRYLITKCAISTATGILVWIILALFGLKLAALFGLMAFLLNFIPSIGSVIATLLPLSVAIAQFSDPWSPWRIVGVVAVPGAVQIAIGNVLEPKIMGRGLHLHPVTILLALAFWGLLWGVVGMLLAVPITATIRIILMRFITTRPIGNLLAGELPGADDVEHSRASGGRV